MSVHPHSLSLCVLLPSVQLRHTQLRVCCAALCSCCMPAHSWAGRAVPGAVSVAAVLSQSPMEDLDEELTPSLLATPAGHPPCSCSCRSSRLVRTLPSSALGRATAPLCCAPVQHGGRRGRSLTLTPGHLLRTRHSWRRQWRSCAACPHATCSARRERGRPQVCGWSYWALGRVCVACQRP